MKKILTKDFLIKFLVSSLIGSFGIILSLILYIANKNLNLTEEIAKNYIKQDKEIVLIKKDIYYINDDIEKLENVLKNIL